MKQRAAGGAFLDVFSSHKFGSWEPVGLGWFSKPSWEWDTLKSLLWILSEGKSAEHGGNLEGGKKPHFDFTVQILLGAASMDTTKVKIPRNGNSPRHQQCPFLPIPVPLGLF